MPFILCPHHLSLLYFQVLCQKSRPCVMRPHEGPGRCLQPPPWVSNITKSWASVKRNATEFVRIFLLALVGGGGGVVDRDFPNLISGGYCLCRGILLAIT